MVEWELILQKNEENPSSKGPPVSIDSINFTNLKNNFFVKEHEVGSNDYTAVNDFCKFYTPDTHVSYNRQSKKLADRLQQTEYKDNLYKTLNNRNATAKEKEEFITNLRLSNPGDKTSIAKPQDNNDTNQDIKHATNQDILNALYNNMCGSWNDVSGNLLSDDEENNVYTNVNGDVNVSFCASDYVLHGNIGIDNILTSFYSNFNNHSKNNSAWRENWSKVSDVYTKQQLRDKLEKYYITTGTGCGEDKQWTDVSNNLFLNKPRTLKRFCHEYDITNQKDNTGIIDDVSSNFASGYYKNLWVNKLSTRVGTSEYDKFWQDNCISEIKQTSRYYNTISEKDDEVRRLREKYFQYENQFINEELSAEEKRTLLSNINDYITQVDKSIQQYTDGADGALTSDQQTKHSSQLYNNTLKEIINLIMCIILLCYYTAKITNIFKMKAVVAIKETASELVKDVTGGTSNKKA